MKKLIKKVAAWSSETKVGVVIGLVAVVFFTALAVTTGGEIPYVSSGTTSTTGTTTSTTTTVTLPVFDPLEEVMGKPFTVSVQIVRKFFDASGTVQDNEDAIVFYENEYYPSKAVDFALNNTQFDVVASLTGEVVSKVNDPVYGLTVKVASANDIVIVYASLSSTPVQVGQALNKGDIIGKAGESKYGSDLEQNHLQFQVLKNNTPINPQSCFNVAVKNISK